MSESRIQRIIRIHKLDSINYHPSFDDTIDTWKDLKYLLGTIEALQEQLECMHDE